MWRLVEMLPHVINATLHTRRGSKFVAYHVANPVIPSGPPSSWSDQAMACSGSFDLVRGCNKIAPPHSLCLVNIIRAVCTNATLWLTGCRLSKRTGHLPGRRIISGSGSHNDSRHPRTSGVQGIVECPSEELLCQLI